MDSDHKRRIKGLALDHVAALLEEHEPDTVVFHRLDKQERSHFIQVVTKISEKLRRSARRHKENE